MKRVVLKLDDFFNLPDAVIYNPDLFKPVSRIFIDSRIVSGKSLFTAIKGSNSDGHNFIKDAIAKGSNVVMIDESRLNDFDDLDCVIITVPDTVKALGQLALRWRKKLKVKVIGITGSAGKTTTKEILATLLNEKYKVNKTVANNNNHIGVPLTVFSTTNKYDYLVAEMGTNHFGEIEYSAGIADPDLSIITNIGDSHIEFLKNRKGVLKEKSAIFRTTILRRGTIFINTDDDYLRGFEQSYKKRVTFGFSGKSDYKGKIKDYDKEGRPKIEIRYKSDRIKVTLPVHGEQSALNYLAAASVALHCGLGKKKLISGTSKIKSTDKRIELLRRKDKLIINDSYNANPDSMNAAIDLLKKIKTHKNKVAILGDMFELGENAGLLHKKLAAPIVKNKIDTVYLLGDNMRFLFRSLKKKAWKVLHFTNRKELISELNNQDFSGSVILIKGSRGMKMEEFINVIDKKAVN